MQSENRLFDDLARLAGGAINALGGLKSEVETLVRQQIENLVANLNLVTREEFETVQAMAAKARDEQEALVIRLAELEAKLTTGEGLKTPVRKRPTKAAGDDE